MKYDGLAFARSLKSLRAWRGWTQMELASKSGVSRDAITSYETQKRVPSLETVSKLADALEVSISDLLKV